METTVEVTDSVMEEDSTAMPSEKEASEDVVVASQNGHEKVAGGGGDRDPPPPTATAAKLTDDIEMEPPMKKPRIADEQEGEPQAPVAHDTVLTDAHQDDKTAPPAGEQPTQGPSAVSEGTNTTVNPAGTTTASETTGTNGTAAAADSQSPRTTGGATTTTTTTTVYRKHKYNFLFPLAVGEKDAASGVTPPAVKAAAQHLVFGKGGAKWNAHLRANPTSSTTTPSPQSSPEDPKITTMEILQQAQERLVFPPTRFPPRESPLHQIFTATSTPRGDRRIFGPLEECYREMLEQDSGLEDVLRKEYKPLFKKNQGGDAKLRRRVGQILVQGQRLQQVEQEFLTKLKAGLDGSTLS